MDMGGIGKAAVVGGIVAIVVEFLVGWAAPSVAYGFGFVAMLLGGFIAGWMVKGKKEKSAIAGVAAALIYVILGLFIIYPLVSKYHSGNPVGALIIGIVLGAIAGFVAGYLNSGKGSSKNRKR